METTGKWIDPEDKLPAVWKPVILFVHNSGFYFITVGHKTCKDEESWEGWHVDQHTKVRGWMELPMWPQGWDE